MIRLEGIKRAALQFSVISLEFFGAKKSRTAGLSGTRGRALNGGCELCLDPSLLHLPLSVSPLSLSLCLLSLSFFSLSLITILLSVTFLFLKGHLSSLQPFLMLAAQPDPSLSPSMAALVSSLSSLSLSSSMAALVSSLSSLSLFFNGCSGQ